MSRLANRIGRRTCLRSLMAAIVAGRFPSHAVEGSVPPLPQDDPAGAFRRRYRADAQILLFGLSMLRRKDVGDGKVIWRDSIAEDGAAERFLAFMGRSTPERAAGLNRFGFIQELSRHGGRSIPEAHYFGVMTASNEESADEARKALQSDAKEVWFSAVEGRISTTSTDTVGARFLAPAGTSSADRPQLITRARAALSDAAARKQETRSVAPAPQPFLHALADLLRGPGAGESQYMYNGHVYRLRVKRSTDSKAAKSFRELGLIGAGDRVLRVEGSLWREGESGRTEFKLWVQEGAELPVPLRIEYQPNSYLRLTFEARA